MDMREVRRSSDFMLKRACKKEGRGQRAVWGFA
jgi:hypothetical protein